MTLIENARVRGLCNSKIQLWWKTPIIPADNSLFDPVCSDISIFVFVTISVILVGQYSSSFLRIKRNCSFIIYYVTKSPITNWNTCRVVMSWGHFLIRRGLKVQQIAKLSSLRVYSFLWLQRFREMWPLRGQHKSSSSEKIPSTWKMPF